MLAALDFLLIAMNVSLKTPAYVFWPELTSLAVGYSVIGAIIASRLPNHPIGWLCCAIGLIAAVDHFAGEYSLYALVAQPHPLPGGRAMLWLQGREGREYRELRLWLGFSDCQLRAAERRSVMRVMSSSCSQPSPTKE
jgi:hypothetical protein